MALSLEERFWKKVNKTDTCWLWMAAKNNKGYGVIGIGRKLAFAHRLSYEWANGPIPTGLELDHSCRTRNCVNPAHLEAVTHLVNMGRWSATFTHCPQGHPRIPPHAGVEYKNGKPLTYRCLTCRSIAGKRRYAARQISASQT